MGGSYFYFYSGNIICVLVARSVLDALLKRGSSVVMGCSDQNMGQTELERVRYEATNIQITSDISTMERIHIDKYIALN